MSDADEVGQEVGQHARVALTIALQMGEKFARLREDMARDAGARTAAEARELSARFDAERGAARAALQVTDRPEWWANASVQDVARVAETAQAWKDHDPIAERAAAVIQREVRDRYGVDTAVLRDAAGQGRAELDLAKEWAATSAPEYYHRHDEDRLTMQVGDRTVPDVNAERALVSDYRAALGGDVGAVELSAAEEWKRATDPAGFQDYRVQTSIDWTDTGHVSTPDSAAVAAARAELVEQWKDAVAPERARAGAELLEAHLLITEADRIDRANDSRADRADQGDSADASNADGTMNMAAELEARANDYDRDADAGGTKDQTPDQLRELAADARAQAQLFQDNTPTTGQDGGGTANQASVDSTPRASASREAGEVLYDSAERRQATIQAMQAKGIPPHLIEARMSADTAHATPASAAVTSTAKMSTVQPTRKGPGQGKTTQRGDLSR
ncbi:hypothetical protein [Subtercola boreus]|uniref:Uncharacterized protein n=1 Tax=Subtercola boreus TaxID=120213 RepID=A0A3E0W618_9MICO|nr:hypothetical protein [Subtercola boreus]RFA17851.1 hypothetical protein B7R23_16460 [Subtercola boreus]RFA24570.1 hypothetical protein B7R25_16515 [Subtercola boreus]